MYSYKNMISYSYAKVIASSETSLYLRGDRADGICRFDLANMLLN